MRLFLFIFNDFFILWMFHTFKQYIGLMIHDSLPITPPTLSWHLTPSLGQTLLFEKPTRRHVLYKYSGLLWAFLCINHVISFHNCWLLYSFYPLFCICKFAWPVDGGTFMQITHNRWAYWDLYTALGPVTSLFIRHVILQIESSLTKIEGSPSLSL